MNKKEIKCPTCSTLFKIDEEQYASILQQVYNDEFKEQIKQNKDEIKSFYESKMNKLEKEKEVEIKRLKEQNEKDKNAEILLLKSKIDAFENEKKILGDSIETKVKLEVERVREEYRTKEEEIKDLKQQLDNQKFKYEIDLRNQEIRLASEADKKINELKSEKQKIEHDLNHSNEKNKLMLEKEKSLLENNYNKQIINLEQENKLLLKEIDMYKDFKAKQSVKEIGESLEKHCENEFAKFKSLGFKNAYFAKDNDASNGTKGDFIYRDYEDGIEFISIMFEMKNESENSSDKNKKKNSDFFEKLHKDRVKKNCEYAILVSMLEQENELYNNGIVDVSTADRPKMFVIRPQFFIPLISLLKNAALNSLKIKKELEEHKKHNADLTMFNENIIKFKEDFGANTERASNNFSKAIEGIDQSIKKLQNIKEELMKSGNQLRIANEKVQGMSLKKLTKNCENIRLQIEEK